MILETGEPREVQSFRNAFGIWWHLRSTVSCTRIHQQLIDTDMLQKDYYAAVDDYNNAVLSGIVKIASKMGISQSSLIREQRYLKQSD